MSLPQFHEELFTLVMYNMTVKQQMVRTAGWQVQGKHTAEMFAKELSASEVSASVSARQQGNSIGSGTVGSKFLKAVDVTTTSVPHTNEAAKHARQDGEAYQHHFGLMDWFLTVSPDDENNILVQILSGFEIDDDEDVGSLSDVELSKRAKRRTELRIKYPGLSAYFFELAFQIVMEVVVGWDLENECPTSNPGLFGIPEAFIAAIEEQGRRTLHTHISLWVKKTRELKRKVFGKDVLTREQTTATKCYLEEVNEVSSCKLFSVKKCRTGDGSYGAFPHDCTIKDYKQRQPPTVVSDQQLRNLRHRLCSGCNEKAVFAKCPHCEKTWTNAELVESYLINGVQVPGLKQYPDNSVRRLKALAMEYQRVEGAAPPLNSVIFNAAWNHHIHAKSSCFGNLSQQSKSSTKKRKRVRLKDYECRYRHPKRSKTTTVLEDATDHAIKWFSWHGSYVEKKVKEVCHQRHKYDAFQNVSCPAISESKLACNTNIMPVLPGPLCQYQFKYGTKGTQKDDTEAYGHVAETIQKVLSRAPDQQKDSDRSEAMRRVLAASFAHQKTNVVGAPMASWLTRYGTQFIMSHKTVWCPLHDIESLLDGGEVNAGLSHDGKSSFFQVMGLNYLCRSEMLEDCNVHDFFARYEVVKKTKRNEDDLLGFVNEPFKHPCYHEKTQQFRQGIQSRKKELIVKVFQYDFEDAATFGGSILDSRCQITDQMEKYCKLILLLFHPLRSKEDIMLNGSYTQKLRELYRGGKISARATTFLQNLQDARSNCFRVSHAKDDLQRCTEPYQPEEEDFDYVEDDVDEEEDESQVLENVQLDHFLKLLDDDVDSSEGTSTTTEIPSVCNFDSLKNKGVYRCGYESVAQVMPAVDDTVDSIFEHQASLGSHGSDNVERQENNAGETDGKSGQSIPTKKDLVSILMKKKKRRTHVFPGVGGSQKSVKVLEANGSVFSIMDWAKRAKLDRRQRRAFEVITGSFVLTFFSDARIAQATHGVGVPFQQAKKMLAKLVEKQRRKSDQLICLLHGPGGSGKSTVIDLVMDYAKEYCSYMDNYEFTARTIVVTALTGVAATILLGETTHAAVYLNQKRQMEPDQVELWEDTRLLIIDEVSFAGKNIFQRLNSNLMALKQQRLIYGGLNIVFSGDFQQLEPVAQGIKPIYEENCPEFRDCINSFIELNGMHRFRDDMDWGNLLLRFREGEATKEDIKAINERVVEESDVLPDNLRYATYFNRDRDAINAALFEKHCKQVHQQTGTTADSIMIFCDDIKVRTGSKAYVPFRNPKMLWQHCGEDDVKPPRSTGRMDPVLKLYKGCPVMLPKNTNVQQGQANGTQATVQKVVLKSGVVPRVVQLNNGVPVHAVKASEVAHVELKHCNDCISPSTFSVEPQKYSFDAHILKPRALQEKGKEREYIAMKANQVPLLVNNATTGHKLQGSGVDMLFVHNWSYTKNWVYVMLSHVKTKTGLFCRRKLSTDLKNYAVPPALQQMLDGIRSQAEVQYWSKKQYKKMFPK